jgi:hypothetical protein
MSPVPHKPFSACLLFAAELSLEIIIAHLRSAKNKADLLKEGFPYPDAYVFN